jgi:hypothetical protein
MRKVKTNNITVMGDAIMLTFICTDRVRTETASNSNQITYQLTFREEIVGDAPTTPPATGTSVNSGVTFAFITTNVEVGEYYKVGTKYQLCPVTE